MCRYSDRFYKSHYVCFDCRISFKLPMTKKCPKCNKEMIDLGRDFHPPKKTNKKAWVGLEILHLAGIHFESCGCTGPGYRPTALYDIKKMYNDEIKKFNPSPKGKQFT